MESTPLNTIEVKDNVHYIYIMHIVNIVTVYIACMLYSNCETLLTVLRLPGNSC